MNLVTRKIIRVPAIAVAGIVVIIQFIRPLRNHPAPNETPIQAKFPVPSEVQSVLKRSCYDCHSNRTDYPWYANVQPVGWWLQSHIDEGKREVNFDEYSSYQTFRQFRKFHDIKEQLDQDEMPLPSYLLIHRYAKLSPEEKALLVRWSEAMQDSMKSWYPADSLRRQRPSQGFRQPR